MTSAMSAYVTIVLTTVIFLFPVTHSSTVGVEYVSRLLQVQEQERAPDSIQLSAAKAVLDRFIPSHSSSFEFQIITKVIFNFINWLFIYLYNLNMIFYVFF